MMLGMGHNCLCVRSILYIPGCLPENDFRCYLLALTETNTYLCEWQGLSKTRTKSGNVEFQSEFCFQTLVLCKKEKNERCYVLLHCTFILIVSFCEMINDNAL